MGKDIEKASKKKVVNSEDKAADKTINTVTFAGYTLTYAKGPEKIDSNNTWQSKINEWNNTNKNYDDYKQYRNHISSLKNRVFSEKEWEIITDNWSNILEKISYKNNDAEFIKAYLEFTGEGEENDLMEGTLFYKLKKAKDNGKQFTRPKAEMYRMIAAFNLDTFCPIVNEGYLNELIEQLKEGGYVTSIKKDGEDKEATLSKIHWCIKSALIRKYFGAVYGDKYTDATPWGVYLKLKDTEIKDILEHNQNLILTGAPGTGKTFLAKKLVAQIIGCEASKLENKKDKGQWKFVQFHPSYDYTDFVEGLRPKEDASEFERKDGIFKEFCSKALVDWQETWNEGKAKYTDEKDILKYCKINAHKYVFIIDEINRGEISKIFGELFFSIDPGYRGKDGIVQTQYQNLIKEGESFKDGFYVPENVYIIGTMNDIDRSVESLDFAFRRRFAFYEIKATNDMLDSLENIDISAIVNLKEIMNELNRNILEQGLTEAYQIGGAYFKKIEKFYDSNSYNESKFKQATTKLWNLYLQGTLYEYFRGEPDGMEKLDELKKAYFNAVEKNS